MPHRQFPFIQDISGYGGTMETTYFPTRLRRGIFTSRRDWAKIYNTTKEWKDLFKNNTEVHLFLGTPLRLNKSLYGDRVANLAWDETQSAWLTSKEIGFQRLPSDGSIYIKRTDDEFIAVLVG